MNPAAVLSRFLSALVELTADAAPMLLLGLGAGALVQSLGARLPVGRLIGGRGLGAAARGLALAVPLPVCSCGVLPVARSLELRGAAPGLVVAFLLATPELGLETFALTARLFGVETAAIRAVAAVALALGAAVVVGHLARRRVPARLAFDAEPPTLAACLRAAPAAFVGLLDHTLPWIVAGLLGAAAIEAFLPVGSVAVLSGTGLDYLLVTLLSIPSYVCAASSTPVAAVLVAKGLSPGAALVGLLLGPATNVATLLYLRSAFGARAAFAGIGAAAALAWGAGLALDGTLGPTLRGHLAAHVHGAHASDVVSLAAAAALAALSLGLFARRLSRRLRPTAAAPTGAAAPLPAPHVHGPGCAHGPHAHAAPAVQRVDIAALGLSGDAHPGPEPSIPPPGLEESVVGSGSCGCDAIPAAAAGPCSGVATSGRKLHLKNVLKRGLPSPPRRG
jgi:uncharacterized membrane protein YraQ (UPF0718 family)